MQRLPNLFAVSKIPFAKKSFSTCSGEKVWQKF